MKRLTILLAALIMVVVTASAQAKQTVKVLEYCPAPGQFTNNLPEINNTMSAEERLKACEQQLEDGNLVCLGAAGGYITVALDQPIKNGKGSDTHPWQCFLFCKRPQVWRCHNRRFD